ncbi:hypothetical protein [Streptomyces sp. MMBL 11-1]|uniref:hypothetical protein n=1 Tax=Streptomyces sp. MMBL 11-1 TaxID=3026420 RepID=UPI00235FE27A|nr:hypothetical protein [Streptomyces sp. MMBL 11-1]
MPSSRAQFGEAVRLRQQATGESYNHVQLLMSAAADTASVIPAPRPAQQWWESYIVGLLAPVFGRHNSGSLFGIRSVTPAADHLMVRIDHADLAAWAHALVGAERAPSAGPRMRIEAAPKGVKVIEDASGAMMVLDRAFPRQWRTAIVTARASQYAQDGSVERAVELSQSLYGFEASALLRRPRLVTAAAPDGQVHLEVRQESDGHPRLFTVGGTEPRPALWHALDTVPKALYPAHEGPTDPAPGRADQQDGAQARDQRVLDAVLAYSDKPYWKLDRPAQGIGWGDVVLMLGRMWPRLDCSTRKAFEDRSIEAPDPEWLAMYERLWQWTVVQGRPFSRSLSVDGHPVGNWVWKHLHRPSAYARGKELMTAALADIITFGGPHRDLLPYVPPQLPYRASLDRARRAGKLEDLLEQDEAMCRSTRAPAIARAGAPDPARGLVIQVCLGYQDAASSFTLTCRADHTWVHLAEAIDRVFARDDDVHLAGFYFNSATWKLPSPGNFYYAQSYECLRVEPPRRCDPADKFVPGQLPSDGTALSAMLAPGFALGYLFDYGDKWMHNLRVLRWTHPDEDAQLDTGQGGPLLAIRPLTPPPNQYDLYEEDEAPDWDHYLALPSLRQARPDAGTE